MHSHADCHDEPRPICQHQALCFQLLLEPLLGKYQDEGIVGGLDNVKMLETPPFNAMGTPFQLIKGFCTRAGFENAVHELQAAL